MASKPIPLLHTASLSGSAQLGLERGVGQLPSYPLHNHAQLGYNVALCSSISQNKAQKNKSYQAERSDVERKVERMLGNRCSGGLEFVVGSSAHSPSLLVSHLHFCHAKVKSMEHAGVRDVN